MILKIPNEYLDSLVRGLNKLILFLDYRIIRMDEVTFQLLANQKAAEQLKEFGQREKQHIDAKGNKLKESTHAEETLLSKQVEADNLDLRNQEIEEQVHYCTLTLFIYQKPILVRDTEGILNSSELRPNLFKRIGEALVDGWEIVEYIIVFLFRIWWLFAMAIVAVLLIVFDSRRRKLRKQSLEKTSPGTKGG
jgi:hypothetical protein